MKLFRNLLIFIIIFTCAALCNAQTKPTAETAKAIKGTPAYAELLLRQAELESDIESFLASYTEEYPKLKEARFELGLLNKDLTKLLAQTDISKLTLALGKLLVRKNQLETDVWALLNRFGKEHPDVKRAQRKALSFENAVKQILP